MEKKSFLSVFRGKNALDVDVPNSNPKILIIPSDLEKSDVFQPKTYVMKTVEEETKPKWTNWMKHLKIGGLVAIWLICSTALMMYSVQVPQGHQISVPHGEIKKYLIRKEPLIDKIELVVTGALLPSYYKDISVHSMSIWVQLKVFGDPLVAGRKVKASNIYLTQNVSDVWEIPLVAPINADTVPAVTYRKTIHLSSIQVGTSLYSLLELQFKTNLPENFPLEVTYNLQPINPDCGIIYAACILIGLYILIIFELVHRALAAMLASTMSVAILATMNARPTLAEIITWIDIETLLLLFSMMIIVSVLNETGVFDYMSVIAYKVTGGKIWPLMNTLCVITAILSCFLDNVTTTLLTTPVTIRLCDVMKLNPVPVLMYMLIFSNIGGVITPIGDPPNVIIASNSDVIKAGINFGVFTLHMSFGALLTFIVVYAQLRYTHNDGKIFKYALPHDVQELKHRIAVWKRVAASISSISNDEEHLKDSILKTSTSLQDKLKVRVKSTSFVEEEYTSNLKDLKNLYPIKNKKLLIKAGFTLFLVICVFFLHSVPEFNRLGLGWTALLGALLLLVLYNGERETFDGVLHRVEWSTLLFFAALFVMMEALARLGLIDWFGLKTESIIMSVDQEYRLIVAIVLLLWVVGFASAFVDNLPLTTMMIRIITNLANNQHLNLPLAPLVWALSFGACFGGNGTLFGSSSNIVCAGIAEQHGHRFTFLQFFRIGFPVMVSSLIVVSCYLILCHVVFGWH